MPKDLDGGNGPRGPLSRSRPRTLGFVPFVLLFPFSACDIREDGAPPPDVLERASEGDSREGDEAGADPEIRVRDAPDEEAREEPRGGDEATDGDPGEGINELVVTATAFNSLPEQTHPDHPTVTAWGYELEPGMRIVAVSRDLEEMGIGPGTELEIEGKDSTWVVRDRMHRRWTRRIDLYMGKDVDAAREWGKREVTIRWAEDP